MKHFSQLNILVFILYICIGCQKLQAYDNTLSPTTGNSHIVLPVSAYCERDLDRNACDSVPVDTITRIIVWCHLKFPLGPLYDPDIECAGDYYEVWKDGSIIGTSNTPGVLYALNQASEIKCYDIINGIPCLKKVIRFNIVQQPGPVIYKNHGPTFCAEVDESELPFCLQNKLPLKVLPVNSSMSEYYQHAYPIQFCCNNGSTYYIYDENDPCCFVMVEIVDCPLPPVAPSGLKQNAEGAMFRISPNPASSVFRIESVANEKLYYEKVSISDLNGKTVLVKDHIDSETYIDMSAYSAGTYFIKVKTGDEETSLKLLIQSR